MSRESQASATGDGEAPTSARPRILVVDDSPVGRAHILATLAPFADARAVESGAQGLRALRDGGYSLILCDYEMPDMSGIQFLRFVRAKHSALELPVLLLTGSDDPDVKVRAFRAGANDYIAKQAATEELIARVTTQLELLKAQRRLVDAKARQAESQKFEAMGQLTEALAHELNTPAQYIGDNLEFLQESFETLRRLLDELRLDEQLSSPRFQQLFEQSDCDYLFREIPRCIQNSLQGIAHVSSVVSVMREFARQTPQQAGFYDVNEIVRGAVAVTRGRWHQIADVVLELEDPLPQVSCVATAIKQAMLYALMNAIKAMTPEDGIQRTLGRLCIRSRRDPDWITIEVVDSGRAIADEQLAKMLDRLSLNSQTGDMGQALAQMRTVIVDDHGGELEVTSAPGEGTRVVMRLPQRSQHGATLA